MSLKPYPKYKDSGVEWLGEVPEHWSVLSLRHLVECLDGARVPLNSEQRADMKGEVPYWGANSIVDYVKDALFDEELVFLGEDGAPFFDKSKPVAFLSHGRVWPNNHIHVLRANSKVNAGFLIYVLNATDYSQFIDGSTRDKLTQKSMNGIPVALPTDPEQRYIKAFLNRETGKIDALIAEQEKLISLLAEKRQATISHAVTKGLNPNVKMKDSGVEWMGEVPEHWEVLAVKRLSPVQRGASPRPIDDPKYFDDDGEYAWVRIADVTACGDYLFETTQRLSELGASLSVKLAPGQLFISIAGSVGKPCITAINACIHDGFVYFPYLTLEPRFIFRLFEAGLCYGGLGKLGTQLNLNTDTIGSIQIGVPPRNEIDSILAFLDRETTKIDALAVEANRVIDLLKERRTALISAAVTGKIDVRNALEAEMVAA